MRAYLSFLSPCTSMGNELVVRLSGKRIGMDVTGGELAYISHAHSDHTQALGGPLPIFCSDITADILGLCEPAKNETKLEIKTPEQTSPAAKEQANPASKFRRRKSRSFSSIEPPVKLPPPRIPIPGGLSLHGAGHILGSTQISGASEQWGQLVYTGDFKSRAGLTVSAAPILDCDTLVIECTYGDPRVAFPPMDGVLDGMERWARQNRDAVQLWGGYSTGKAQELVKFINDYLGEVPIVSGRAAQVCEAYRRNGVKLDWLSPDSAEAQGVMRGPFHAVMPPQALTASLASRLSAVHRRKVRRALATGWALVRQLPADAAFPLSDHADFMEILEYAKVSGAKQVFLAHGDNARTAQALSAAGVPAKPIDEMGAQQMLLKIGE